MDLLNKEVSTWEKNVDRNNLKEVGGNEVTDSLEYDADYKTVDFAKDYAVSPTEYDISKNHVASTSIYDIAKDYAVSISEYDLYEDMSKRTGGEMYLGVVGPVRTGKSTFIKRFMDLCVLPMMKNDYQKRQTMDELPQSGSGKMVTTTEPKFIPKEAAKLKITEDVNIAVRLVDCVGYMVESALGFFEENGNRMVKTPWTSEEIPFAKAAEIGTKKVITDHATIGILVTTDGSITDIKRKDYEDAEQKVVLECKKIGKPFIILLNSTSPESIDTIRLAKTLEKRYETTVLPVNCATMDKTCVLDIMRAVLWEFPLRVMEFFTPKWMELLENDHPLKMEILKLLGEKMDTYGKMRDVMEKPVTLDSSYVKEIAMKDCDLSSGKVKYAIDLNKDSYYALLSQMTGETIENEYELLEVLKEIGELRREYQQVASALVSVRMTGYGVVTPKREEITLEKPELIRHGSKYGVKIKSNSPSIFMIRANIENEIAPIVGTESQATDLIRYISTGDGNQDSMWDTNIFGKTVEQMVNDGIAGKVALIGEESQQKLQDTMQKIVNDMNGGMVCIII